MSITTNLPNTEPSVFQSAANSVRSTDVTRDDDYTGVVGVAGAWLLFYSLALGGYALKQGFEVLASL